MSGTGAGSSSGSVQDFESSARAALTDLQSRVGLDRWLLARRDGDDYVVLCAVGDESFGPHAGDVVPWANTFCSRMVDGTAPQAAPLVDAVPAFVQARAINGLPTASVLSVPIAAADGAVLATLCALGRSPEPGLEAALPAVQLQADLLGTLLAHELRFEREVRRAEHAELEACTDPLTGVGNRRAWSAALDAEEIRCARYASPAAVLVCDLDELKLVNDADGHAAGDRLLARVAELIRVRLRAADLLARLGGDEFGILLPETELSGALALAVQLRDALAEAGASVSVGAAGRRSADGLSAAWREADAAMYADKLTRRGARVPHQHRDDDRREAVLGLRQLPFSGSSGGLLDAVPVAGVQSLLTLVREQLGMDVAFLGEFVGDDRIIRYADSSAGLELAGVSEPRSGSYCQLLVDGQIEEVVPDAAAHPLLADLPVTTALDVRGYLGIPVHRSTGELYGTLCTFSSRPEPDLRPRDAGALRVVARAVMDAVERDERSFGHRRIVLDRLDRLYDAGGPTPVFQPVVSLDGLIRVGMEALARFPAGTGSPADWFSAATAAGVGTNLELRALDAALAQLGRVDGYLAVNVSPAAVCGPGFLRRLSDAPLHRLVVEITEHEPVENYAELVETLRPFRDAGLRIAVDDAGAGFASMRHILALVPDLIKLDITLVRDIDTDPARQALAAALTTFAFKTGASVIAEGIETAAELDTLRSLGVHYGQGYHLGRPASLPPDDLHTGRTEPQAAVG